ncbi:MAG: hypothetical protein ACLQVG_10965 [Terriglobia bacterium]
MRHNLRGPIAALLLSLLFAGVFPAEGHWVGTSNDRQSDVILGVLEDHPGEHAGDPNFWRVRAVFEKKGSEWQAFPNPCHDVQCLKTLPREYPKEVTWTIAFDGKNLGQLTARTTPEFRTYDSVGDEEITSSAPVPTVGRRLKGNSGFLFSPAYRPLVAVSKPYFRDPAGWKPAQLSPELVNALRQQFRREFPKVMNCRNPDENIPNPWPYQDKDIMTGKTFSSRRNWSIAELFLAGWACDGPQEAGGPFIAHSYAIAPTGKILMLGSGIRLLGAGDYDGDGESEVLFAIDGYNLGGYRLFYENFTKSVEFVFSYH